ENPEIVLIGTGSEVQLAYEVAESLHEKGISARAVSMPSMELFDAQTEEYKAEVLPEDTIRVAIEASSEQAWYKYVGLDGLIVQMETFGLSGPAEEVFDHFGFTRDKILANIKDKFDL
ncbi:transketolase C-terminal domain-containing protein, partial [uncultured Helcococcus sp.]|uniref:transketolase-like TK C-terminal-containing protein n=1 Tax=uncultured Helcococcus sp. TaxID=1072508 RepID=UPI0026292DBA